MDKQILETIQSYCADLKDVKTSDFYNDYLGICEKDEVEPRQKNVVIREACDICGMKTKQIHITYTVFENESGD